MTFERGSFVTLVTDGPEWNNRVGCVVAVSTSKSKWKYKVAIMPIEGESARMQVKVMENQVKDYEPPKLSCEEPNV